LVGVEFGTRGGGILIMPRISIPGKEPAALPMQLGWTLPEQPPPRIRSTHHPPTKTEPRPQVATENVWPT